MRYKKNNCLMHVLKTRNLITDDEFTTANRTNNSNQNLDDLVKENDFETV